jgi:hypothetical protein
MVTGLTHIQRHSPLPKRAFSFWVGKRHFHRHAPAQERINILHADAGRVEDVAALRLGYCALVIIPIGAALGPAWNAIRAILGGAITPSP